MMALEIYYFEVLLRKQFKIVYISFSGDSSFGEIDQQNLQVKSVIVHNYNYNK